LLTIKIWIVNTMIARKTTIKAPGRKGAARATPAVSEDAVYDRIHGAVLDHRLEPGTKLKEVALAEVFGVNRNVVRKVLQRLAYAKLVELRPNRGATVASPSVAESRDLFAARRAVEAAIVDAATNRIAAGDLRELRAMAKREHAAYEKGDTSEGLRMSLEFHRQLARIAGNHVLAELLDQLMARTPLVILAYRGRGNDSRCSNDDHGDIIDAVASGNAAKAVAAMTAHLASLESQLDLTVKGESGNDLAELFLQGAD
jgi:DNA-binding GntR family transcriptional regulator